MRKYFGTFTKREGCFVILWIGFLLSLPLLFCGYPWGTHDGWIQQIWQETFSRQFWSGEFYPRWVPETNQGFGAAAFFFYPPLPSWIGSLFWGISSLFGRPDLALGWSAAFGLILSGFSMRFCLRQLTHTEWIITLGALCYMVAPYHLVIDLLDRGANSEFWSFVWLPLILGTMLRIQSNLLPSNVSSVSETPINVRTSTNTLWANIWFLAGSFAGLILTHLPTVVTFIPVVLIIAIFLAKTSWKIWSAFSASTILSFGLSAAYWFPAFCYRFYTKGASDPWFSGEGINGTFFFPGMDWTIPLTTNDVFNRRLLYIFLGMVLIWFLGYVVTILGTMRLQRKDENGRISKSKMTLFFCWIMGITLCLLMMLPVSGVLYEQFAFLRNIQFSWRFLGVTTFLVVLLQSNLLSIFYEVCEVREVISSQSKSQSENLSSLPSLDAQSNFLRQRNALSIIGKGVSWVVILITVGTTAFIGFVKYQDAFGGEDSFLRTAPQYINVFERNAAGEHDPVAAKLEGALQWFPNDSGELVDNDNGGNGHENVKSTGSLSLTPRDQLVPRLHPSGGDGKVTVFIRKPRYWKIECNYSNDSGFSNTGNSNSSEPRHLILPQYWFPGWEVTVDESGLNSAGQNAASELNSLEQNRSVKNDSAMNHSLPNTDASDVVDFPVSLTYEPKSGLIQVRLPKPGYYSLELRLKALWPEKLGYVLSLLTLLIGIVALVKIRLNRYPTQ